MDRLALLPRLQAGEDRAYHELLRNHGGRLQAVARKVTRNDEMARDCVQGALLSAVRAIHRFEGKAAVSTWLHRIVVNACLMQRRGWRRKREQPMDPLGPEFERAGTELEGSLPADEEIARSEVRERVHRAIGALPERHRGVLVLREIEELGTAETAARLGITPGAVKTRLHRARLALRHQLERREPRAAVNDERLPRPSAAYARRGWPPIAASRS